MTTRFTIAGALIMLVSGLGAVVSATRYFTGQRAVDRLVGSEGLSYTITFLIYAVFLIMLGLFVPRFLKKYRNASEEDF
ncbi:MAG: hypothetical protein HYU02_08180 [Thaumarchaeota archaeon]|nr:hypothetical protein [Nitrososphaerota archaeon]